MQSIAILQLYGPILHFDGFTMDSCPSWQVYLVDFIPHGWLLPRVAVVAHHGGAGTTGAAFKAGVPQVARKPVCL